MIPEYGFHRQHDIAIATQRLRSAIRDLANDETIKDHVGLGTAVGLANVLADVIERQWHCTRREELP